MKAFIVLTFFSAQAISHVLLSSSDSTENVLEEHTIIQSLIEKDNEITTKEDGHQKIKPRPPQYLHEILEQFETNSMSSPFREGVKDGLPRSYITLKIDNASYSKPRDRLFNVWLPTEILRYQMTISIPKNLMTWFSCDENVNTTVVRFQQIQSRDHFGNFTSSRITLTLLKDAQFGPRTYVKMFTHWEKDDMQEELVQILHIKQGRKFYSFNITKFILSSLKTSLTEPNFIKIGFQAYEKHTTSKIKLDFTRIFDVQVDMPIMMFFYGGFVPSEKSFRSLTKNFTRKRRSIGARARPSSQCQRRNFVATPTEVGWTDVVEPTVLDLGYCSGSCPFPLEDHHYNYTLHSFLLDRYRLHHALRAPNDFPRSTCVPLTYKTVTVLESIGADRIEAGIVRNLSVDTCGCR